MGAVGAPNQCAARMKIWLNSEMFGFAEREIMTCGHCKILRLPPQCEMK
jgi:hypothetical protein